MGELLYISAAATTNSAGIEAIMVDAMRRFCRSVELCDDYLRGYYGLKLVSPLQ